MHRSKNTLFGNLEPRKSVFLEGDSATGNHVVPWISPSLLSIRGYTWIYGRSRTCGWNDYCIHSDLSNGHRIMHAFLLGS